jgi:anti-anti-sigma regulatory factor
VIVVGIQEATREHAPDVKRELNGALQSNTDLVVLDLSRIADMDSHVLGVVMSAVRSRRKTPLRIVCAGDVRRLLGLLDIETRASLHASVDEALRHSTDTDTGRP